MVVAESKEIRSMTYDNSTGETDQQFELNGSETVETSSSWSVTGGFEIGAESKVNAIHSRSRRDDNSKSEYMSLVHTDVQIKQKLNRPSTSPSKYFQAGA